jgi:ABC-type maltose transport system permease subunit
VGFVAIFKHFSGFGFFLLSSIFLTHPHATNANRWLASLKNSVLKIRWLTFGAPRYKIKP